MAYAKDRPNADSDWSSRVGIAIGLIALIPLAVVLKYVYHAWVPSETISVGVPQANASVTLYHYRNFFPVDGKYVQVRQNGKKLNGHTFNPDWIHYPRLSIYLTPDSYIGIIGPYDDQGQIFDLAAMKVRHAKPREADAWTYLGVFTHVARETGFLRASDRAECLDILEQLTVHHARPDARKRRCD